jgi:transcriptional regulator with XRE-family HTH domain
MTQKTTDDLLNELRSTRKLSTFIEKNRRELKTFSLPEYLQHLLIKKGYKKADVIRQSGLDQVYAYHIFSGDRSPSRNKVLALALAFHLTLEETQYLLQYAHLSKLYVRNPWDSIIIYALQHRLNVLEANELLANLSETSFLE